MADDNARPKLVALIVLDGWGIAPAGPGNALTQAKLPNFLHLCQTYPALVLSPSDDLLNLSQTLAEHNLRQIKIAQSVGFVNFVAWLNNGQDKTWPAEERQLIPTSPDENLSDAALSEITDEAIKAIGSENYDVMQIDLVDAEVVGKSGDLAATVKTLQFIDDCLGRMIKAVLQADGVALVVGRHGKAELMLDMRTDMVVKELTNNPLPLILVGQNFVGQNLGQPEAPDGDLSALVPAGSLGDVEATMLKILGIETASGKSLV